MLRFIDQRRGAHAVPRVEDFLQLAVRSIHDEEAGPAAIVVVVREIPSQMPNFAYPLFLLLALAVPLVVWLWLRPW